MGGVRTDTTTLLSAISAGDQEAGKKLFAVVYRELHSLAHREVRKECSEQALRTTELVHETYLRLVPGSDLKCRDRSHFFKLAGRAMRHILIDEARKRKAIRRGRGEHQVPIDSLREADQGVVLSEISLEEMMELDRALDKLGSEESQELTCAIVDLHFFVGLSFKKIAETLGLSKAKVVREWTFVRTWLRKEIDK